jgi:hypothetical protein
VDTAVIRRAGLGELIDALKDRGYTVIGPTVRDDAIVLAEIGSADELPFGVGVSLDAFRPRRCQMIYGRRCWPWSPTARFTPRFRPVRR